MSTRRPYIPLDIRVLVAERQLKRLFHPATALFDFYLLKIARLNRRKRLTWLLQKMWPAGVPIQLDHDPALILRPFDRKTGKYTPDANDPDYLIFRTAEDHQQKTTGRRPDAERTVTTKGSDIWLKTKFARLEKPSKPRARIAARGFDKTPRKIPSRPFPSKPAVDK